MSEVVSTEAKPKAPPTAAHKNVFTEIERWLALIREISLEQAKSEPV